MANILLGVTGSVAAVKVPELFDQLRQRGHSVRIVATRAAVYFFDPAKVAPLPGGTRSCGVVATIPRINSRNRPRLS